MPPARKVLLVDDDMLICWALENVLKKNGYEVSVSRTGGEAQEKLIKNRFDMVITDLKMEDVDGLAVLEEASKHNPPVISILMTAFSSESVMREAFKYGAYYMVKPIQVDEFIDSVQKLFERKV